MSVFGFDFLIIFFKTPLTFSINLYAREQCYIVLVATNWISMKISSDRGPNYTYTQPFPRKKRVHT